MFALFFFLFLKNPQERLLTELRSTYTGESGRQTGSEADTTNESMKFKDSLQLHQVFKNDKAPSSLILKHAKKKFQQISSFLDVTKLRS